MKPHMFEFYAAMQDLLTAGEPQPTRRKPSCRGCGGTGDMPSGRACTWCALGDPYESNEEID